MTTIEEFVDQLALAVAVREVLHYEWKPFETKAGKIGAYDPEHNTRLYGDKAKRKLVPAMQRRRRVIGGQSKGASGAMVYEAGQPCMPGERADLTNCIPKLAAPMQQTQRQQPAPRTDPISQSLTEPNPKTGIPDRARVGVPGMDTPPPPDDIQRLPNLSKKQRKVETAYVEAYLKDPDGMAQKYLKALRKRKVGEYPNVFATDDVKMLNRDFNPGRARLGDKLDEDTRAAMAKFNAPVHQTANAIAKRAFLMHLDTLKPGTPVLVTNGGCHAKDTPILMFDGTTKMSQDVMVGDQLMGPDSLPRAVVSLVRGHSQMFKVTPKKGDAFVVNEDHILAVKTKRTFGSYVRGQGKRKRLCSINLSVRDVIARGKAFGRNSWLYRTGVDFAAKPVKLDPYFLGLWLGDGTASKPEITSADSEVAAYLSGFVGQFPDLWLRVTPKPKNLSSKYYLAIKGEVPYPKKQFGDGPGRPNKVVDLLRECGVWRNKHIPHEYLANDRATRLQVLAGLLDSDGSLSRGGFDFISKIERLADGVVYLARSLGLAAYKKKCRKRSQTGFVGVYYRVGISGHVSMIPTKVKRKQAKLRSKLRADGIPTKDVLNVGYSITAAGPDDYYGFNVDGDHLYLMGDFTVTHNCAAGKGSTLKRSQTPGDPHAGMMPAAEQVGAIWDAAGEQNATENEWVLQECQKRGLKPIFAYVWADPKDTWSHPERGVIRRAIRKGRMVDARLFADSYALGAKNMHAFVQKHPDANFIFIDNRDKKAPKLLDRFPEETLRWDSDAIYRDALQALAERRDELDKALLQGGLVGTKIWGSNAA